MGVQQQGRRSVAVVGQPEGGRLRAPSACTCAGGAAGQAILNSSAAGRPVAALTLAMLRMITQALRRMGVVRSVRPRTSRGTRMDRVRPSTDCSAKSREGRAAWVSARVTEAAGRVCVGLEGMCVCCMRQGMPPAPPMPSLPLPPAHLDEGGGGQLVHAVGHLAGRADAADQVGHKGLNVAVANGSAALGERLGGRLAHSGLEVDHAVGHHRHNLGQVDLGEGWGGGGSWLARVGGASGRAAPEHARRGGTSGRAARGGTCAGAGAQSSRQRTCIHASNCACAGSLRAGHVSLLSPRSARARRRPGGPAGW